MAHIVPIARSLFLVPDSSVEAWHNSLSKKNSIDHQQTAYLFTVSNKNTGL